MVPQEWDELGGGGVRVVPISDFMRLAGMFNVTYHVRYSHRCLQEHSLLEAEMLQTLDHKISTT